LRVPACVVAQRPTDGFANEKFFLIRQLCCIAKQARGVGV